MGFSLVAESEGYSPVAVCVLLIAVASLVAERGLYVTRASIVMVQRLCFFMAGGILLAQGSKLCLLQ